MDSDIDKFKSKLRLNYLDGQLHLLAAPDFHTRIKPTQLEKPGFLHYDHHTLNDSESVTI